MLRLWTRSHDNEHIKTLMDKTEEKKLGWMRNDYQKTASIGYCIRKRKDAVDRSDKSGHGRKKST